MTGDASESCLGLVACVGSATRQIVVARVLLTAAAPPALPSSSVTDGSLAPPCSTITGLLRSARHRRHVPGDGPDEAGQLTGDRRRDDIGRLAAADEFAVAHAQLPNDLADWPGLRLLPQPQLTADPGWEAVNPGRLDQQSAAGAVCRGADLPSSSLLGRSDETHCRPLWAHATGPAHRVIRP